MSFGNSLIDARYDNWLTTDPRESLWAKEEEVIDEVCGKCKASDKCKWDRTCEQTECPIIKKELDYEFDPI
jgi:hypothetical protein